MFLIAILSFFCIGGAYAQASSVIREQDFRLKVQNKWDKTAKKSFAKLEWDTIPNMAGGGYTLYQSEDGNHWEAKSTKYGQAIKVLNVFPDVARSNTLKTWMDGLGLKDRYGNNLIQVTAVSLGNFNSDPVRYLKNNNDYMYDVIMFGSWDWNASRDLVQRSADELQYFINSGRGVLFGHDTITGQRQSNGAYHNYFNRFASQLGFTLSTTATGSTRVKVKNDGYMMKYPFELANSVVLTTPISHSFGQLFDPSRGGTIWLEYETSSITWGSIFTNEQNMTSNFYLATNKNLGMIQTGHSNGASTVDERRILANTLYNLAQVTMDSKADDYTVKDTVRPDKPKITYMTGDQDNFRARIEANDTGKRYQWFVEADTKDRGILRSDQVEEEIKSDIQGYIYKVDDSPVSSVPIERNEYGEVTNIQLSVNPDSIKYSFLEGLNGTSNHRYLHAVAVDRANNVSETTHVKLKDLMPFVLITKNYQDEFGKEIRSTEVQRVYKDSQFVLWPSVIPGYRIKGYQLDEGVLVPLKNTDIIRMGKLVEDHRFKLVYTQKIRLVVRQVVHSLHPDIVEPFYGLMNVSTGQKESQQRLKTALVGKSSKSSENLTESSYSFLRTTDKEIFEVEPLIPMYYRIAQSTVNKDGFKGEQVLATSAQKFSLDYSKADTYYVTVYLDAGGLHTNRPALYSRQIFQENIKVK